MSFTDWLEKHADQEMEIEEVDFDVENGDPKEFESRLNDITESLNKLARKQAEINAKSSVLEFLEMDRLLKEQGFEDKEERLRIIEIIY